jgi:hypothetical protein
MQTARQALLEFCEGAARRSEIDTPDSWMRRADGARLRQGAIDALDADREIGPNIGKDRFLHVAGVAAGSGLELLDPWLGGLLHRVLIEPGLERPAWESEVNHFLDVLRIRDGTVPCTVSSAFAGIVLPDGGFKLDDGIVRPAVDGDFHVPIGQTAPAGITFEYRVELPASATPVGFSFPDELVAEVETVHQTRLTRFLLAVALTTEAPIQEQLVMKRIDFGGGGSGGLPEEVGPIVSSQRYLLDEAAIGRICDCYAALAGKDLGRLGVATRRYLIARTERVRPTDQIIDYAIALESMTAKRYGDKQGKELGRLLADTAIEREAVESEHERFRAVREAIVHDGVIPPDARAMSQTGRDLVKRALWARSRADLAGGEQAEARSTA